jgi:signal transduction histidine kinase
MMTRQPYPGAQVILRARGTRAADWGRRHPVLTDVPLVTLLLWQSGLDVTRMGGMRQALATALILAMVLPLLWRRRAPFAVFGVIFAAALVQVFLSQELTDDLALLVAFYTVAAHEPPRRVLAAVVALEVGAVLVVLRLIPAGVKQASLWAFATGLVGAAGLLGYYVRGRREHLAALVDRAERLEREREREAQLAASAERTRIAREMHDIVAHNIAVMIALAEGAAYTVKQDPDQAVTIMGHVSQTGRSALTEMRRLLGVLRQPGATEAGNAPPPGLADLDDLLATTRTAGLPTRLTVSGQPFPLPPTAQLALYRMSQEALTNTLKHAAAASAEVRLTYRETEVELEITDDGCPKDAATAGTTRHGVAGPDPRGQGIAGMRERAAVFAGDVSAGPRPEGGWRVHTVLRIDPAPAGSEQASA